MAVVTIPAVTSTQMREVDRMMVEELHVDLLQMMENAGRNLADLCMLLFRPRRAIVLAGPGGNGGGGLAGARHLANRGVDVVVALSHPLDALALATARQLDIVQRMGIPVVHDAPRADLVVDALIGYGLHGDPRDGARELIDWANGQDAPVLSLDVPSGLDATTG